MCFAAGGAEERERGMEQNALLSSIKRAFGSGEVVKFLTVLGEPCGKGEDPGSEPERLDRLFCLFGRGRARKDTLDGRR